MTQNTYITTINYHGYNESHYNTFEAAYEAAEREVEAIRLDHNGHLPEDVEVGVEWNENEDGDYMEYVSLTDSHAMRATRIKYSGHILEINGEAYYTNGSGRYQCIATDLETREKVMVYWDIIDPEAEWEEDMCDWDHPAEVEGL